MRFVFACLLLVACGSKQPAAKAAPPPSPPPDAATVYDPSGCTPQPGVTAEACTAQGCQIGAHPYCSGVEQPPEVVERASHGPCECVCPDEIQRCAEVP